PVSALELLFDEQTPVQFAALPGHVIVVTSVTRGQQLARRLRLNGQKLLDVVPAGHLRTDAEIECWGSHFGSRSPLLIVAPDLDSTRTVLESGLENVSVLIIDASQGALAQSASMRTLCQRLEKTHIIILARDQDLSDENAWLEKDCAFVSWEWTEEDL